MDFSVCCIKGCNRQSVALGLCSMHYRRNRMYGSPVATKWHSGSHSHMSIEDRFMQRVRKTDSCWLWLGSKDRDGYPLFMAEINGERFRKGHRVSYAMFRGKVGNGILVCHTCDNPSCVNPDHLFLGTSDDNMKDKAAKGRSRVPQGEKSPHAKLTQEQAQAILIDARPYIAIANEYGISATTVGSIKQRASWPELSGVAVKAKRLGRQGSACYRAVLTDDDVRLIRSSADTGKSLAEHFKVSRSTITDIRKNRSWKHIH